MPVDSVMLIPVVCDQQKYGSDCSKIATVEKKKKKNI